MLDILNLILMLVLCMLSYRYALRCERFQKRGHAC